MKTSSNCRQEDRPKASGFITSLDSERNAGCKLGHSRSDQSYLEAVPEYLDAKLPTSSFADTYRVTPETFG